MILNSVVRRGKSTVHAFVGVVAMAAPCAAADLGGAPPEPSRREVYDSRPALAWTGFYVGGHAGVVGAHDGVRDISSTPYDSGLVDRFRLNGRGFGGGGQLGYNYQIGSLVVGLEGDIGYANGSRSGVARNGLANDVTAGIDGGFRASLRPRLGYAFGNLLVYGTGGVAFGRIGTSITDTCTDAPCNANAIALSQQSNLVGWTVGGGLEYMLDRNWTTKVEYLHTDFGNVTTSGLGADGSPYSWRSHVGENTIRAGVNYKF